MLTHHFFCLNFIFYLRCFQVQIYSSVKITAIHDLLFLLFFNLLIIHVLSFIDSYTLIDNFFHYKMEFFQYFGPTYE